MEFPRRVDLPLLRAHPRLLGGVARPPEAGGVEVFEAKAERVEPPMAAGALWLLLMGHEPLPGGEQLALEP